MKIFKLTMIIVLIIFVASCSSGEQPLDKEVKPDTDQTVQDKDTTVADEDAVVAVDEDEVTIADEDEVVVVDEDEVIIVDEDEVVVVDEDEVVVVDEDEVVVVDEDEVVVVDEDEVVVVDEDEVVVVDEDEVVVVDEDEVVVVDEDEVVVVDEDEVVVVDEDEVVVVDEDEVVVVDEDEVVVVDEDEVVVVDEDVCVPQCDNKVCGENNCGGTCGDGCGDYEVCSEDQTACESTCQVITPVEFLTVSSYSEVSFSLINEQLGSADFVDVLYMELFGYMSLGPIDLAEGDDNNYGTCDNCFYLRQDINLNTSTFEKLFYPIEGTIDIMKFEDDGFGGLLFEVAGTIDVKLAEVTLDENNNSIPVVNGECLVIENASFDTYCKPSCGEKVCGDDGCGGICGDGCEGDTYCNAEGTACNAERACIGLSIADSTYVSDDDDLFYAGFNQSVGHPFTSDIVQLELYDSIFVGDYNLAESGNNDYESCLFCVLGFKDLNSDISKKFMAASGNVEIVDFTADIYGYVTNINAVYTNVVLWESTILFSDPFTTTPVEGGECWEVSGIMNNMPSQ